MVGLLVRVAPIGAFGALAYTVGQFGVGSLMNLGLLMVTFFATCALFVFLVLGAIARMTGFSLLDYLAYLREELLIVLGTASSRRCYPISCVRWSVSALLTRSSDWSSPWATVSTSMGQTST